MEVTKYLIGLSLLLVLFGVSYGFNYATDCGHNLLVWGTWQDNSNVQITITNLDGQIVYNESANIINDYQNSEKSGVYYANISLQDINQNYIVTVTHNGVSDSKVIYMGYNDAPFVKPHFSGKIVSVSQGQSKTTVYAVITNMGKDSSLSNVYLYARNGVIEKKNVQLPIGPHPIPVLLTFTFDNSQVNPTSLLVLKYKCGYSFMAFEPHKNVDTGSAVVYANELSIRKGQTETYTFSIKNTENYAVTYNLQYDSNLNVVGPNEVTVGPNQTASVQVQVSADRNFNGIPYFNILLNGKSYSVKVAILPAVGFNVTSNLPDSVLVNSIVNAKLNIVNVGDLSEKVNFYYTVNGVTYRYPYTITLMPGESFSYPVSFVAKDTGVDFAAYVNGEKVYSKDIIVNPIIKQFYAYTGGTSFSVFKGNFTTTTLVIQNTGNVKDTFKIYTSKDVFASESKVTLLPNEIKTVKLTLYGSNYGQNNLSVKVCDGSCKTYNLTLFVDMPVKERANIVMADKSVFVPNETFNYTITIDNKYPLSEQTYSVFVNGTLKSIIKLKPNESKNVTIQLKFNDNKVHEVPILITSDAGYKFNETVLFTPKQNKVPTGLFILNVNSVQTWALIALAVIGGGFLVYYMYMQLKGKVKVEKTVLSNDYR